MPRRSSFRIISALLISFLVAFPSFLSSASARTWRVSKGEQGDFQLVQAGIDAAQAGDSVVVGPGTYLENIRFKGRDIVLRSLEGAEATILDGSSQNRSVVEFFDGESNACVIEGFTLTGGRGSAVIQGEKMGGGIFIQDSEPTILRNTIVGNTAMTSNGDAAAGGGIFCRAALPNQFAPLRIPRIIGNTIDSNTAGLNAGGIGIQEKASAVIIGNEIVNNRTLRGDGAGIWIFVRQNPEVSISSNIIHSNTAADHGGGILAVNSFHGATSPLRIRISENIIFDNVAEGRARVGDSGGGAYLYCTDATVVSNTIVRNIGQGPGNNYGGGFVLVGPGNPTIERNVIALTLQGGGIRCSDGVTPTIQSNIVWSNDGGTSAGICTNWAGVNGNVQADPLFCNAANNDFSLPANSPAMTHPAGPLGAISVPGCAEGVIVESTTWGGIKARWRSAKPTRP